MKRFILSAALFSFIGCATTRVTDSWRNPEFQGQLHFNKVLVMAIAKDETTRRITEDELSKFIGEKATPSHQIIELEDFKDNAKVKAAVKQFGADGLVVIRPIDVHQEVNYVPGMISPVYSSPWGYSNMAWGRIYEPGYLTTDTIVKLETNIYSAADEKLIWSGASESFNPSNIKSETKNLAVAVKARLQKEKLLP